MRWFTSVLAMFAALALAAPAASAWALQPVPSTPFASGGGLDAAASLTASLPGAAACVLGDVDLDGHADLLVRAVDAAGHARLEALAGPHFTHTLWTKAIAAQALLQCAPDLGLDGVADPVLRIAGEAQAHVEGAQQKVTVVLQSLDGATGATAVARTVTETVTGPAVGSTATAQQVVHGTLLPAASGALAQVTTQATAATALAPTGALGLDAVAEASLTLLDAGGRVVGTVTVGGPGVNPLALAPVPGAGLPQVAALTTQAVSQVEGALAGVHGAAAQVPTLSLYSPDGTLQWAVDLAASVGTPTLLPRPGDLDLDGVPDLLVQTVEASVGGKVTTRLNVISGLDGQLLFATEAVAGAVTALPLGTIGHATAILQAVHAAGAAELELVALDGMGSQIWSVTVDASARAANLVRDPFSGDLTGFTDLTGDAVADVALAVTANGATVIQVLDGIHGEVAWTAELADVTHVIALAESVGRYPVQALTALPGQASDLLAVGTDGGLTLAVLDGVTGQLEWTAKAALPEGQTVVSVQSAGDLDGDHRADLLVTVGPVQASAEAPDPAAIVHEVHAISSATGQAIVSKATTGTKALIDLELAPGPAYAGATLEGTVDGSQESPAVGPFLAAAVLALAFAARRRKA